ncbi:hypothetical protein Rsub_07327 [Raphidocelis subcapitata]|uniref:Histone deacetylase complex subunit SAP30 Sin3 binding domain-containing protein n=1 Tax=Raphidocelis subcapitata TaxID=307507 RepID=A0A2V0P3A0_9CHLO|nr:hypothetical protein Rsub_07327 [Raphidocelis subcapitata]|eukprot:GBF94059.1 hypothetical protein Rsub_07327 [Raphidocelis subcapitata]
MAPKRAAKARDLGGDWLTDDADWGEEKPAKKAASSKQQPAAANGPRVDVARRMDAAALERYRALFKLPGDGEEEGGGGGKGDLASVVSTHFTRQVVDEDETLLRFVVALRRAAPKGLRLGAGGGRQPHVHSKPERAPVS